jgi:anti-sigma28 factor (negative regulator of flagellin synthesis)
MKILRHPAASRDSEQDGQPPAEDPAPDRVEKVRRLKDLVQRGEYEVDEELLARRIAERWFKGKPSTSD